MKQEIKDRIEREFANGKHDTSTPFSTWKSAATFGYNMAREWVDISIEPTEYPVLANKIGGGYKVFNTRESYLVHRRYCKKYMPFLPPEK